MNFKTYKNWFISQTVPFENKKIDLYSVLDQINASIPHQFISNIDGLYVIKTEEMERRKINAIFVDGVIYVSPEQSNNHDLLDDIVHEIAHSVELNNKTEIYYDNCVENEFITKRTMLSRLLTNFGYKIPIEFNDNIDYNEELDLFLLNEVGYNILEKVVNGIFMNAYSVTSIQEYWAVAFEKYFLGDYRDVKRLCPQTFQKIESLIYEELK